ncbi:unnamed protein product [Staurois parvus]|uniref:Ataxin-7-like protein 1 n=1 Tax=Staurois parvus TaxID=386267 RepID=A0ABN9FMY9_9NEOB|nr:unnamed protein product [Staurois parvus]
MATLDRKVPSPEAFLGKPWSTWIDAAKIHCSDNVDLEETGKEGGKSREVMRLNKEGKSATACARAPSAPVYTCYVFQWDCWSVQHGGRCQGCLCVCCGGTV